MFRVAVFADAGYIWVQFGQILKHIPLKRSEIEVDVVKLRTCLLKRIREIFPNRDLLRIYWYDGLSLNMEPNQFTRDLAAQDDFKVRYGTVNSVGQQKGVDGLLIADLLSLAQNKSITDALIISGDGDLAPGVAAAQALGVRIHRLELGTREASSPVLRNEVDANSVWSDSEILSFIRCGEQQLPEDCAIVDDPVISALAQEFCKTISDEQKSRVEADMPLPHDLDSHALCFTRDRLQRNLTEEEKTQLRQCLTRIVLSSRSDTSTRMEVIARKWTGTLTPAEKQQLQTENIIPRDYDRRLLACARGELQGRMLTPEETKALREAVHASLNEKV